MSDQSLAFQIVWEVEQGQHIPDSVAVCCSWNNFKKQQLGFNSSQQAFIGVIDVPYGDHLIHFLIGGQRAINDKLETVWVDNNQFNIVVNDGNAVHLQSADKVPHIVKRFQNVFKLQTSNESKDSKPSILESPDLSLGYPSINQARQSEQDLFNNRLSRQSTDFSSDTESSRIKRISFSKLDIGATFGSNKNNHGSIDKLKMDHDSSIQKLHEKLNVQSQQIAVYNQIMSAFEDQGLLSSQQAKTIKKFGKTEMMNEKSKIKQLEILINLNDKSTVAKLNEKIKKLENKLQNEEKNKHDYVSKLKQSFEKLKNERETECEMYESEFEELKVENMELSQIIEKLESKVEDYEQQLKQQAKEKKMSAESIDSVLTSNSLSGRTNEQIENEKRNSELLQSMREHVQKLGNELVDADKTKEQLIQSINELKASVEYYQLDIERLKTKNQRLHKENSQMKQQADKLNTTNAKLTHENSAAEQNVLNLKKSMSQFDAFYNNQLNKIEAKIELHNHSRFNGMKTKIQSLKQHIANVTETHMQLQNEQKRSKEIHAKIVQDLSNQVETVTVEKKTLTQIIDNQKKDHGKQIEALNTQIEQLTSENSKLAKEKDTQAIQYDKKLAQKDRAIKELRYKCEFEVSQESSRNSGRWKQLQSDFDEKCNQVSNLETDTKNLEVALQNSENMIKTLEHENKLLQSQLHNEKQNHTITLTSLEAENSKLQTVTAAFDNIKNSGAQQSQIMKSLQIENENYAKQVKDMQNAIEKLSNKMKQTQQNHDKLVADIDSQREQFKNENSKLTSKHLIEINNLLSKISKMKKEIDQLQQNLQVAQSIKSNNNNDSILLLEKYNKLKLLFEQSIEKCKQFESEHERLKTKEKSLKSEVAALKQRLNDTDQLCSELKQANDAHMKELTDAKQVQINQMRESLQRSSALQQDWKQQVTLLENKLLELNNVINQQNETITLLTHKLDEATSKNMDADSNSLNSISPPAFEVDLADHNNMIEDQNVDQFKSMQTLIDDLKKQIVNLKYTLKSKNEEIQAFTQKSNLQVAKIMDLKTELRKVKSEMRKQQQTNSKLESKIHRDQSISSLQTIITHQSNQINEMQSVMRQLSNNSKTSTMEIENSETKNLIENNISYTIAEGNDNSLIVENKHLKSLIGKMYAIIQRCLKLMNQFRNEQLEKIEKDMMKFINLQKKDINMLLRYLNVYISTHPFEFPKYHSQEARNSGLQILKKHESPLQRLKRTSKILHYESTLKKHYFKTLNVFNGKIKTICRVRPLLDFELEKDTENVIKCHHDNRKNLHSVTVPLINYSIDQTIDKFQKVYFDCVLSDKDDSNNTDIEAFNQIKDNIIATMDGYDVSVMCYGATGSGKTYTITNLQQNVLKKLFDMSQKLNGDYIYKIDLSMFEIYNEQLRDLLKNNQKNKNKHEKLQIRQCSDNGIYIENLNEIEITNIQDALKILIDGEAYRTKRATRLNHQSSRSHVVTQIKVKGECIANGMKTIGLLNLVDLAGSEKIRKLLTKDEVTLKESKSINKSLSSLCTVLNVLANTGKKSKNNKRKYSKVYVPFRDSILTRILQPSLSGSGKCLMYFNVSPGQSDLQETLATINFAQNVVKNVQFQQEMKQNIFQES